MAGRPWSRAAVIVAPAGRAPAGAGATKAEEIATGIGKFP